jgi:hypothetical protein
VGVRAGQGRRFAAIASHVCGTLAMVVGVLFLQVPALPADPRWPDATCFAIAACLLFYPMMRMFRTGWRDSDLLQLLGSGIIALQFLYCFFWAIWLLILSLKAGS